MRTGARRLAVVPLSALVLLAGCGGGDGEEAASSSSPAATSTAAPTTTPTTTATAGADGSGDDVDADAPPDAAPFPADTDPDTADAVAGAGPTVVTGVRIGSQDGVGRVVFDVAGTATPGWDVQYTDTVTQEGTGQVVSVPGQVFLRVLLTGVTNPYEAPGVTETTSGNYLTEAGPVAGVYYDSTFEGQAVAYVGVDAERPFRVFALSNPTRVVVDVQG